MTQFWLIGCEEESTGDFWKIFFSLIEEQPFFPFSCPSCLGCSHVTMWHLQLWQSSCDTKGHIVDTGMMAEQPYLGSCWHLLEFLKKPDE